MRLPRFMVAILAVGVAPQEGVTEAGNLRPIRFLRAARFGVNGGNGSLQGVGTARMQRLPDEIAALGNGGAVPEAAILLLQGDKIAFGRDPGRPSGILEEEKRQ